MNEMQVFKSDEFGQITTIEINGKPYFLGNDIAKALGYAVPKDAITRHCKGALFYRYLTNGGEQEAKFIPEGDIYRLVVKSQLPDAERFESWVFDEVLPTIRQTGGYHLPQTYSEALRALADKAEEAERLAIENQEMKPKAEYFDALIDRKLNTSLRDTAKELGIGERAFITFLLNGKYIYRDQKKQYRPYADKNKGLFELKEYKARYSDHAGLQVLITPKGRETFRLLLCGGEQ